MRCSSEELRVFINFSVFFLSFILMWRALCHCRITLIFFIHFPILFIIRFLCSVRCHYRMAFFFLVIYLFFIILLLCGMRCITAELPVFYWFICFFFIIYLYVACAVSLQNCGINHFYNLSLCGLRYIIAEFTYLYSLSFFMYVCAFDVYFFEFFLLPNASPRIFWQSWFPLMIIILGLWTFW